MPLARALSTLTSPKRLEQTHGFLKQSPPYRLSTPYPQILQTICPVSPTSTQQLFAQLLCKSPINTVQPNDAVQPSHAQPRCGEQHFTSPPFFWEVRHLLAELGSGPLPFCNLRWRWDKAGGVPNITRQEAEQRWPNP